ncbi:MAG: hypothetical protein H7X93_11820 [Sphingomonadaceae bacterium]|nr:hypothetical protein [Sphingomonadaceae bacterium]
MKLTLTVCVGLALAFVGGCERESERIERQARDALADVLMDPTNFLLRDLRWGRLAGGQRSICGDVNGKNQFGAFVGFRPFVAKLSTPPIVEIDSDGQRPYPQLHLQLCASDAELETEQWRIEHPLNEAM